MVRVLLLLLSFGIAQAQDRLLNVSVEGVATATEPQTACTIVNGFRALVVLAEATTQGTDPYLEVRNLFDENPDNPTILSNDDWEILAAAERELLREGIGRFPNGLQDAVILMSAQNAAVCADAVEDNADAPAGRISVQITDITDKLRSLPMRMNSEGIYSWP